MYNVLAVLEYYGLSNYVAGPNVKILCPFHPERNPSMSVSMDGLVYCFGCGFKGDIVDVVAKLEGINRLKALAFVMKFGHVEPVVNLNRKSVYGAWVEYCSLPMPDWTRENYMTNVRNFSCETLDYFGVRIDPYSIYSVVIPIWDNWRFKGTVKRRTDDVEEKKYLYNPGFRRSITLAGFYVGSPVMIVEGILDMMKAWEYGVKNVVAILGWKITEQQVHKLGDVLVIDALDNTETGEKGGKVLKRYFRTLRFKYPPHRKDIAEMTAFEFIKSFMETLKEA